MSTYGEPETPTTPQPGPVYPPSDAPSWSAQNGPAYPPSDAPSWSPQPDVVPPVLRGPAPAPVVIGLLGLLAVVSAALFAFTDLTVNWAVALPVLVVVFGAVIVLLGLSGLRGSRT